MQIILIVITVIFVLFLPGFFISFIFFDFREIDVFERLALSLALSLSVIPLVVFFGSLLGIHITAISVIAEILGVLSITGGILTFQEYIFKKK